MTDTVVQNLVAGADRTDRLTMVADDTLTVEVGALFSVTANGQAVRFTSGTISGVTIDNSGTIEAVGGQAEPRAIRFENSIGATLDAAINNIGAASVIHAVDDAIQIQSGVVTAGEVIVTNAGSITSDVGQAIDFAGGAGTFITNVQNAGTITSGANDAIRVGGVGDIDNSGTINGGAGGGNDAGADGIQFEDGTTGTVNNMGVIGGDRHAINAGTGSDIIVTNGAGAVNLAILIEGRNGSGVGSDGDATIVNYGTIRGMYTPGVDVNSAGEVTGEGGNPDPNPDGIFDGDGDGVDADGELTLDNYGLIEGVGANGNGSDGFANTAEGIAAGGGTIRNHVGGTIQGLGLGILIDDSSRGNAPFLTTIINQGVISGAIGIQIISNLNDTISNSGFIEGTGGTAIRFGSGNNALNMLVNSNIGGSIDGGLGTDLLSYANFGTGVSVDLTAGTATNTAGISNIENVTGGVLGDTLAGNASANTLIGLGGADIMQGRAGNDVYGVAEAGDIVDESVAGSGGIDTVNGSISINLSDAVHFKGAIENATLIGSSNLYVYGNALANVLTGNAGANTLIGYAGADTMRGLAGNDVYGVDNVGDIVDESVAGSSGVDTVTGSISINLSDTVHFKGSIENATLIGAANLYVYGNALANVLTGNAGANTLIGYAGADTMRGGAGNDIYGVDNAGDIVDESVAGSSGVDTVTGSISINLSDTVHFKGSIENATLIGSANLYVYGNAFANVLTGNAGANTLVGYAGADTMRGGAGNDVYGVDNAGDIVDESVAGSNGIDTVTASISININDAGHFKGSIENASLIGSANLSLTGNTLGNVLNGNAGANVITGWLGNDTLTGGGGNDVFQFNSALNAATNVDTITDMNQAGNDTIQLENSIFTTLAAGALAAGAFTIGASAADADDRIVYNSANGQLSYDINGNAAGGATLFAILDPGLALTAADFFVV